MDIQTDC